jgi:hypothetical protein
LLTHSSCDQLARAASMSVRGTLTAQLPVGMGISWANAAPAKVAARMAKDFILTVGWRAVV